MPLDISQSAKRLVSGFVTGVQSNYVHYAPGHKLNAVRYVGFTHKILALTTKHKFQFSNLNIISGANSIDIGAVYPKQKSRLDLFLSSKIKIIFKSFLKKKD